ncbi:MAG: FAD-binding oxidoreductase [Myxococcaceae bacterium]
MPFELPGSFLDQLSREFPRDFLTRDSDECREFGRDWTREFAPAASAVAFPRTTDEVSRLLRACSLHRVPVVPSGGRTGLAGGAMATQGELVLSLSRMHALHPVDVLGATVRVQAGAVTQAVHEHCAAHGLTWPVDFASKGSSQVGGNIATNAGGVRVIRYGLTRQWVLGLEVVLPSGEVLQLNGALEKNNTGVDLRQLFIGSEGTLGVITEATLKLQRLPALPRILMFALPRMADVLQLFASARQAPFVISAYEYFTQRALERVQRHRKLRAPFEAPAAFYVLLEAEPANDAALEGWLASVLESGFIADGVLAQNATQAAELWALRESISESLSATGLPHKNDIAVPIAALAAFCAELDAVFAAEYPDWEVVVFGHIGDGNLHVNVMKPDGLSKEGFYARTAAVDQTLFRLVQRHGGTISAEHGIGLLKRPYLGFSRTPAEIELMRAIKRVLDPQNIMNPGKAYAA